uniref:Uncharacterized protein n=1 Tax=Arundo donax TaxID=35708 RepID=A0A0A9HCG9_ARUDO
MVRSTKVCATQKLPSFCPPWNLTCGRSPPGGRTVAILYLRIVRKSLPDCPSFQNSPQKATLEFG